jgi:hypothetical protein
VPQPTATPILAATPTPEPPGGDFDPWLVVSTSSNKSAPVDLHGAVLSGNIYVWVDDDADLKTVVFFIDDPELIGERFRIERFAPFDLAGGTETSALPYDTTKLANGEHNISVLVESYDGTVDVLSATFTVNSSGAPAPTSTPAPTATPVPAATSTPVPQPAATSTPVPQPTTTPIPLLQATATPVVVSAPSSGGGGGGGGFAPAPTPTPTPAGLPRPNAPFKVIATASGTSATVEVMPSSANSGLNVTGYRVLSVPQGKLYFIDRLQGSDTIVIPNLEPGSKTAFQVRAINASGLSSSGTLSNEITIGATSTPTTVVAGAPSDAPGTTVTQTPAPVSTPTAVAAPAPTVVPTTIAMPSPVIVPLTATPQPVLPTATPKPAASPTPIGEIPDVATIGLAPGWNLISFQVLPEDRSVGSVFGQINGLYTEVKSIINGQAVSYVPGRESNTLTKVRAEQGYWVKMSQAATLVTIGKQVDRNTAILLAPGWNIVPYLIEESWPVRLALSSIAGKYDEVRGFDGEAKSFFPALPPEFNTLTELIPGEGYLIHAIDSVLLVYP